MNLTKTQNITLTTSKRAAIQDPVCLLGFKLDQHLTWSNHIDLVCSRMSKGLYALRKLASLVDISTLRTAYYSLVHSHLSYGIILWGASSTLNRAFVQQKRAVRIMSKIGPRESCRPFFKSLGILTVPCQYIYSVCLRIHPVASSLLRPADVHAYETRGRNLLAIPASKTCASAKNKLDLRLYNALPDNFKIMNYGSFKSSLKSFLLERACYSIDEYL